jgi:hypothetical protein
VTAILWQLYEHFPIQSVDITTNGVDLIPDDIETMVQAQSRNKMKRKSTS